MVPLWKEAGIIIDAALPRGPVRGDYGDRAIMPVTDAEGEACEAARQCHEKAALAG